MERAPGTGGSAMRVILFQDQFAERVRNGTKPHTIRKTARCKPGDTLSLRRWTGTAYRSKQETLREETCVAVLPISIGTGPFLSSVNINGELLNIHVCIKLARDDGFSSFSHMLDWFRTTHGLPFEGVLIAWREVQL
jgi:hypothetical protein